MENKTKSTISVIVPIYKVEQYLPRCIDSILLQTFTDFELILVDDGSPDNCPRICDEYGASDSRIRVIHKQNAGVSAARNTGLEAAQGEYIAFCDSDDYWAPDFLKELIKTANREKADCVAANYTMVDETGSILRRSSCPTETRCISNPSERWNYIVQCILDSKSGWEVWTRLFRSDIIREHGIRFCTTCDNYAEDMGFTLEYVLYANRICSIPYDGYFYMLRNGSMMRSSKNVVKLSQLNEVSSYVGEKYKSVFLKSEYGRLSPVLHFLIMNTEYGKMIGTERYASISEEIKKIQNIVWYRTQVKGIFHCRKYLKQLYGKRIMQQILLLSHYCLHGNWKRFRIESAIAYRWFIKEE